MAAGSAMRGRIAFGWKEGELDVLDKVEAPAVPSPVHVHVGRQGDLRTSISLRGQVVSIRTSLSTNKALVLERVGEKLAERSWMLDYAVADPVHLVAAFPRGVAEEEFTENLADLTDEIVVDITDLVDSVESAERLVLLGLYPSQEVRGLGGGIRVLANHRVELVLADVIDLFDPAMDALPSTGLVCELDIIPLRTIYDS